MCVRICLFVFILKMLFLFFSIFAFFYCLVLVLFQSRVSYMIFIFIYTIFVLRGINIIKIDPWSRRHVRICLSVMQS